MIPNQADVIVTRQAIAVIGANGHTGRFVVAELLRRGLEPIAVGRSAGRLVEAGFSERGVEARQQARVGGHGHLLRFARSELAALEAQKARALLATSLTPARPSARRVRAIG